MFLSAMSLIAADVAAVVPTKSVICAVGRVALRDIPDGNSDFADYYYYQRGLIYACPKLKKALPAGYSEATSDAQTRTSIHGPTRGYTLRSAYIYAISAPTFSADLKSATVHFSYECTGLCGGAYEARYVLTRDGWQREGRVRYSYVS